ncbi:HalOD1 output domain-containing protein [Halalkalicoccus tibetensis]|uniref:HalOD1 output domain-containing protein n=1 Tax=Halalkalicoccus tibetensis TaxID=175632 RepID=A0ABD5V633_9EURY
MSARDTETAATQDVAREDGVYRTSHDEETGPLSTTVVLAVSEAAGADPSEFQLYTYVDPDSLDALFDPTTGAGRETYVEFVALEHRVTVYGSGEIEVQPVGFES